MRVLLILSLAFLAACVGPYSHRAQYRDGPLVDRRASVDEGRYYEDDLRECRDLAEQSSAAERAEAVTWGHAVWGAALGGLIGSTQADFGKGALIGAGVGLLAGLATQGEREAAQKRLIVARCLDRRGYMVLEP